MIWFTLVWFLYCLFLFSLQDLNLTGHRWAISHSQLIWWQSFISANRLYVMLVFLLLTLGLIWGYFRQVKTKSIPPWSKWLFLILIALPVYPLLSFDIFNYLFNAKMVLIYHANPHVKVALDFAWDPMLRFMHNVTTPAPYAYGWTALSLVPGLAWFTGKFTLAFWLMKLFVIGFWLLTLKVLRQLVMALFPKESWRWWLFALNPLVLVEVLINGHNDLVMMFFALSSYWFLMQSSKLKAVSLLLLSASIKYVTILLLPFYFLKSKFSQLDLPTIFAVILTLAMFTRPDQLHSWYLIWAFSFAVLSRHRFWISLFTALTLGGLLRYAPYLYFGHWDPPVYLLRNLIWAGSLLFTPLINRYLLK